MGLSRTNQQGPYTQEATISPTTNDLYWAAGIFEGEGTVAVSRKPRWCTFAVSVSQKDPWILYKFQNLFGGSVRTRGKKHPIWQWSAAGARGRGFLMTMYKLLSPRRRVQAKAAIDRWLGRV